MSRVLYRYYTDTERDEVWCDEHVMSVYADEWEDHIDEWHRQPAPDLQADPAAAG